MMSLTAVITVSMETHTTALAYIRGSSFPPTPPSPTLMRLRVLDTGGVGDREEANGCRQEEETVWTGKQKALGLDGVDGALVVYNSCLLRRLWGESSKRSVRNCFKFRFVTFSFSLSIAVSEYIYIYLFVLLSRERQQQLMSSQRAPLSVFLNVLII
uniref:Uncharacterized protein n=1 Tax=Nothobranchius furzeri TaxID=105023 RepID=A0A1A7ZJH8_NOTFU